VNRREFITLLGGAAAAGWPLAAQAQQPEQMRRVGVLMSLAADDAEGKARLAAFLQGLQQLGWIDGRNVRIDTRWGAGDADRTRRYAAELVALAPDVILATGSPTVVALQQATRSAAIVFADVGDPVGQGFVETLARPGGNTTGFMLFEYAMGGKWLELLKEIAPGVTRVAVLRDTASTVAGGQLGAIQAAASALGVELSPVGMRDAGEIERSISTFARSANGGLVVAASTLAIVHREPIITLAARYRLPAVYFARNFVAGGGLIAYGPNQIDPCRRAAGYVDRILKGEKPSDLPVQAPTKYDLVVNLKTAKALGLEVPATLLARRIAGPSQERGSTSAFGGNSDIEQTPSNDRPLTQRGHSQRLHWTGCFAFTIMWVGPKLGRHHGPRRLAAEPRPRPVRGSIPRERNRRDCPAELNGGGLKGLGCRCRRASP
jgi:putative ABC transport system substrate-binding protein